MNIEEIQVTGFAKTKPQKFFIDGLNQLLISYRDYYTISPTFGLELAGGNPQKNELGQTIFTVNIIETIGRRKRKQVGFIKYSL